MSTDRWDTRTSDLECRNYRLGIDLAQRNVGPALTPGERRILESLHELHRKVDNQMPLTQAQFDADLAPFIQSVGTFQTAALAAISARDATITDLNAQLAALQSAQPTPPDFSNEDQQVVTAQSALQTALQSIPTAPGAVPPATLDSPVVPQFVKDAQAQNALRAPEQSA